MKYILSLVFALLAAGAQAIPMISLVPSNTTLAFNQEFTVDVFASGVEAGDPLLAFGFDVNAVAGLIYSGATVAPPFLDDSALFASTDVAGSVLPAVSGDDILLSTLAFSAGTDAGLWDLSIGTSAGDLGVSEGLFTVGEVFDIAGSLRIEVVGGAVVPVPATLLLVWLGLLGLGLNAGVRAR